ncbi:MAG: response regulator transcription factor [Acidimicrobiia bacterium]|nr:MAG: response regulator transcription factor [Acidimicrobiia bacterium]
MAIRIVLAEDNYLMREGISSLIEVEDSLELVASCENYDELIEAVDVHRPDVVITDIRMPPTQTNEGIRAANLIRERYPEIGVVVLSQYAEPDYAVSLFEHGSAGRAYLLKEKVADLEQLKAATEAVSHGGSVVDPDVVDVLVASQKETMLDRLTDRETEVLAEIAKGRNNAGVAEALFVSERAVEKHINSIFTKLDLSHEEQTNRRVRAVLQYLADQG